MEKRYKLNGSLNNKSFTRKQIENSKFEITQELEDGTLFLNNKNTKSDYVIVANLVK